MHGKGEFAKTKSSICNISIEAANIYNILPRPADSNSLTVVKVKRYLKYRRYVYFFVATSKCYMPRTKLFKNTQYILWGYFHFRRLLKQRNDKLFRH